MLSLISRILIFYAPAYLANASNAISYYLCTKKIKNPPLDKGKKFVDGERILGKGRRFSEVFLSLSVGPLIGLLEGVIFGSLIHYILLGVLQGIGVLLGSVLNSFFKRRLKFSTGKFKGPTIIFDWTNQIIGATFLSLLIVEISPGFFLSAFAFTLVIYPIFCLIGYKLNLRRKPW